MGVVDDFPSVSVLSVRAIKREQIVEALRSILLINFHDDTSSVVQGGNEVYGVAGGCPTNN